MRQKPSDLLRRELARQVREMPLTELLEAFRRQDVEHAFLVFENGQLTLSHPELLAPLKAFLEISNDFAGHEGVFIGREGDLPTLFFAFVHDTRRGLSQGGLRLRGYDSVGQILEDGLRLSQGMTRKNALAGLWWGGGKGILPMTPAMQNAAYRTEGTPERREIFQAYARFVASLGGIYYSAEDVGTKTSDMDFMLAQNRFQTCISDRFGGSGNPSAATARGVFWAMQAAWRFLTGAERLHGVKVAVQGAGNVGGVLIRLLDEAGAQIWTCDVNPATLEQLREEKPHIQIVEPAEILALEVDIVAPCAIGDQINVTTIPTLRARLVCGAANNILGEPADAERLRQRGILFVPDYVCNRMGITNCADEWQGYLAEDVQVAAQRLYPDTLRILKHAKNLVITTTAAADELADIAASELHPLIGHRGRRLIDHLIASGWHRSGPKAADAGRQSLFVPSLHEPQIRLRWRSPALAEPGKKAVESPKTVERWKTIAAAPISTASRPSVDSLLSAVLADVRARSVEAAGEAPCRRVLGADHGGLNLQLAVERSLPYDREEVGRNDLVEACLDLHHRNDAAAREQLKQLGALFEPSRWLDPMSPQGQDAVQRLFHAVDDAGLLERQQHLAHHCPRCSTVLVASDVRRTRVRVHRRITLYFPLADGPGKRLETHTFLPELLVGAVAVAVQPAGPFGDAAGRRVLHPLSGAELPVVGVADLETAAAFLVPAYSAADARRAQAAGIEARPPVYDDQGRVLLPSPAGPQTLDRRQAREEILRQLGPRATSEEGEWSVATQRCRRCQTLVLPCYSEQLFLHLERLVPALEQAIHSGAVGFHQDVWRDRTLQHLATLEPLCISRQQWWGNAMPGSSAEVLSTWFSLLAWSLTGAGWSASTPLTPLDEVYVNPELLLRWVVPSQLVALALTGRPAFRNVVVHGSVHLVDRALVPVPGVAASAADEERFVARTRLRPMRKQLGNVVEPATLVQRFGADALRLGLLLCLGEGDVDKVTLAEGSLRRARRLLHRLVAQVGGLQSLIGPEGNAGPLPLTDLSLTDQWLLERCAELTAAAREAYSKQALEAVGALLEEAVETLRAYGRLKARQRDQEATLKGTVEGTLKGTVEGTVLGAALGSLAQGFSPVCPYVFAHLEAWSREKGLAQSAPSFEPWVAELVRRLQGSSPGPLRLAAADTASLHQLQGALAQLEALCGREVTLEDEPAAARIFRITTAEPNDEAVA